MLTEALSEWLVTNLILTRIVSAEYMKVFVNLTELGSTASPMPPPPLTRCCTVKTVPGRGVIGPKLTYRAMYKRQRKELLSEPHRY